MALLSQLLVRGIRSVGVEDEDAHVIKFLAPLTIISGPNGTGKTTIIEALNYATSGEMPPGKYATFIHSLNIARRTRVDGMVKLEFIDSKKRKIVATKRLTALKDNKLKAKMKCSADECTIQITRPDGSKVGEGAHKVMDTKQEIINLLGVPKAILSNVIFCHQEDSCWPLSEPKELKTRFDRIFQLTRFVKAVDQMKKLKKDYEVDYKRIVAYQKSTEMMIKAKAKHMKDRDISEAQKNEAGQRLKELKANIDRLTKEIREAAVKIQEADRVQRELCVKRGELIAWERQLQDLRVPAFVGRKEDLEAEIQQLKSSSEYKNIEDERIRLENTVAKEKNQILRIRHEKKQLDGQLVQLKASDIVRQETTNDLEKLASSLCNQFNYHPQVNIHLKLSTMLDNIGYELQDANTNIEQERVELQGQMDAAQNTATETRVEAQTAEEQITRSEREIREIEGKLRNAAGSEEKIAALNKRISELEASVSSLPPVDESRNSAIQKSRQKLRSEVENLRWECRNAEEFAELAKEKERKVAEREEAGRKLETMLGKHEEDLEGIFGRTIEGPWSQQVSSAKVKAETKMNSLEGMVSKADLALERERQTLKQLDAEERKVTGEVEALNLKVEQTCGCVASEVDSQLSSVRKELKSSRKELGPLSAKAELYESWTDGVKANSCCPLCDRRFSSKGGASNLVDKLQNMTLSLPEEEDRLQRKVAELEEREKSLAAALVYAEQIGKLDKIVHETAEKKAGSEEKLKQAETHSKRCKTEQTVAKEAFQRISRVSDDVSLMDSLLKSISNLDSSISTLDAKLPQDSLDSFDGLKKSLNAKEAELNSLVEEGEKLQRMASERGKLTDELMKLRESRVGLGETAAQSAHLQEQLQKKRGDLEDLQRRKQAAVTKMPQFELAVKKHREHRESRERKWREEIDALNSKMRDIQSSIQRLDGLKAKLKDLTNSSSQIDQCHQKIHEYEGLISAAEAKCGRLEAQMGDLEGCKMRLGTLEQQLSRMLVEERVLKRKREINDLCPLSEEELQAMKTEYQNAVRQKEADEREKSRIDGQLGEVNKKHKEAATALSSKEMKDAEKDYRDVLVDKLVCERTIEDLTKYGLLLDSSILQFHSEKMTAINEILDDLWRKVYKGVDIESIKIKAEAASGTDKRRSYDYKVAMIVEGGVEVEMRDRCSAGQKMLACILIRIALADVFGGLCSIIALDEPTTNLDVGKVEHMAEMLNDLIAARRTDRDGVDVGRQFQMIVITHDERLVDRLTLGCRPDYHYVLGKNDRGLSYIKRQYPDGHIEGGQ